MGTRKREAVSEEMVFGFSAGGMKLVIARLEAANGVAAALAEAVPHLDGHDELQNRRMAPAREKAKAALEAWAKAAT